MSGLSRAAVHRVILVDDSATVRRLLRAVIEESPDFQVVGEAEDPLIARTMIRDLDPDVLVLDVEMPKMNGLEFLRRIMALRPMPVVMSSTLTHRGSQTAMQALSLGAVEVFGKPVQGGIEEWRAVLPLMRAAAQSRVGPPRAVTPQSDGLANRFGPNSILALGSSTGGVDALERVLGRFGADCPPTFIVQHMPRAFLESLVHRLGPRLAPDVRIGSAGECVRPGTVYVAPGEDAHMAVSADGSMVELHVADPVSGHRPSVDTLFDSLVPHARRVRAALLTGMGKDGARALRRLRDAGAATFAQDEASSVVFGMPKAALDLGAVDVGTPLDQIAQILLQGKPAQSMRRVGARP